MGAPEMPQVVQSDCQVPVSMQPEIETGKQSWSSELHACLTFAKRVDWLKVFFLILLPIYGISQIPFTPLYAKTAAWAAFYYLITGIGITAGYHRLWAHTSYTATAPLRAFLALAGAGAVQGTIRWWARNHRAHHRYTDTEKDPYSVISGVLYAHMGWILMRNNSKATGRVAIQDLDQDKIVIWQHKYGTVLQLVMGAFIPIMVPGLLWNDWRGGFVYALIIRLFLVHQATFCVNSLAHWLGETTFDNKHSPRDHYVTALFTFGEGYHNFHHTFPNDFRNALEWWQYDPTKWFVLLWEYLDLAHDLKRFRFSEIEKCRLSQDQIMIDQKQRELDLKRKVFDWGVPLETLPVIEWEEYVETSSKNGQNLVAISGVIHDLTPFMDEHPGGKGLVTSMVGKDATANFNGGVYNHSNAARNLLATMRVGVLRGGGEVEIWKSQHPGGHEH